MGNGYIHVCRTNRCGKLNNIKLPNSDAEKNELEYRITNADVFLFIFRCRLMVGLQGGFPAKNLP